MRGGEGKELRMCAGARVSLLHTRDRVHPPLPARPTVPGFIVSARMHRYRRTPIVSLFFPPSSRALLPFPTRAFFLFLFSFFLFSLR